MLIERLPATVRTARRLSPFLRPVTNPIKWPPGRATNIWLTSVLLRKTLTPRDGSTAEGRSIRTNASPPEIKSARFESMAMLRPPVAAIADVHSNHAITAAENHWRIGPLFRFISSPPGLRSPFHHPGNDSDPEED